MTKTDIIAICHANGLRDSVIINEIILVAKAFDGSVRKQYREVVEYIRAVIDGQ